MKKITCAMLVVAGLGASAIASAAGTSFPSGALVDRDGTTQGYACALLGEGVTLNLSKNVSAAYSCNVTTLDIRIAACHAAGSRKATQIDCAVIGKQADGTPIYNDGSCNGTTGQQYTITDFRVFEGSSGGGTVSAVNLGGPCNDGSVAAVSWFN